MPDIGSYLQSTAFGAMHAKGNMADYQHASRLYVDGVYALAPKNGWIYYIVFDIDPSTVTDQQWANQQRISELGMLVKSAELPKFTIATEIVNQYNKKTVIQKNITYNPVSFTFHDDMSNVVHNLWLNYYRYYFADSTYGSTGPLGTAKDTVPGAWEKGDQYDTSNSLFTTTQFGLNSPLVNAPFFRSITLYQLNKKVFTSYKLVNPMIQAWEHDKLDQSTSNHTAEDKMTIAYEAVLYGVGQVKVDNPQGFAVFHYDKAPSPLSIAGGGNNSLIGPGGIIPGAAEIFGDVTNLSNPDASPSPLDILGTAIKGANLVRNISSLNASNLRAQGYNILNNAVKNIGNGALSGLGKNLNLNTTNQYGAGGQYPGTPISVVSGTGAGQTQAPTTTGSATNPLVASISSKLGNPTLSAILGGTSALGSAANNLLNSAGNAINSGVSSIENGISSGITSIGKGISSLTQSTPDPQPTIPSPESYNDPTTGESVGS